MTKDEALKLAQPAQKIPYPVTGWKVEVRGSNQQLFITGVYGDTIFVDLPVQPAQEPVGMVKELFTQTAWGKLDLRGNTKVYTAPPQREPLTDEAVLDIADYYLYNGGKSYGILKFARAIETAHGIKGNT